MKSFLIQAKDNVPCHDFGFTLIESIKYNNWYYNEQKYIYRLTKSMIRFNDKNYIPIGSVEFVHEFLSDFYSINSIKPINIPEELNQFKYVKRNINTIEELGDMRIDLNCDIFVKSIDKIKDYTKIIKFKDIPLNKNLLISNVIDIDSEWRAFVYNKELVGLQNYSSDFTIFPDVKLIQDMINDYKDPPPAYTLDVGINKKDGTFLIEIHNFYSCGLYGFTDHRILPQMFIQSFNYLVKNKY